MDLVTVDPIDNDVAAGPVAATSPKRTLFITQTVNGSEKGGLAPSPKQVKSSQKLPRGACPPFSPVFVFFSSVNTTM